MPAFIRPTSGELVLDGRPVRFSGPTEALAAGVAMVHQELAFCENLSVAENLCLGPARARGLPRGARCATAHGPCSTPSAPRSTSTAGRRLTIGQQQMVQIAAALGRGARVVIFDEPTSSLSQHEADRLYAVIGRLRERGVTCIYVSHRLEEIFQLSDAVTVLRDGRHVATRPTSASTRRRSWRLMIGRRLEEYFPAHVKAAPGDEMLRVEGLRGPAGFRDVSFSVRAGEVVGFAGLVGAGRSEVARRSSASIRVVRADSRCGA